jgi:hypothetical protein
MSNEAEALAKKLHEDAFKEFKVYMGNSKPALEKYYSNLVKKQIITVLKNIEGVYPYESRSAEFMRNVQRNLQAL